jgi:hypothetical protein
MTELDFGSSFAILNLVRFGKVYHLWLLFLYSLPSVLFAPLPESLLFTNAHWFSVVFVRMMTMLFVLSYSIA